MPDLTFTVTGADVDKFAAAPSIELMVAITDAEIPQRAVESVMLRTQIRIEPARRRYSESEKADLIELFDRPERWGSTLKSMLWANTVTLVKPFLTETQVAVSLPCTFDMSVAITKYLDGLSVGDVPLCLLFSGTVFYRDADEALQASQISWEREANFKLPVTTWREMMDAYYPNSAWINVRKDVFDRLQKYRAGQAMPTWEYAFEKLLEGNA